MSGVFDVEDPVATGLTGVATLGAAAALGMVAGGPGAVGGAALLLAWLLVPPIFVVALGQVVVAALLPTEVPLRTVALPEAALAVLLLVDVVDRHSPIKTVIVGVASLVAFAGLAVAGIHWLATLWQAAALVVAVAAVAAYAMHRYTVVAVERSHEF